MTLIRRLWTALVRLWLRHKLGAALKEALAVGILMAVNSALEKVYPSEAKAKAAAKSAVKSYLSRLKLSEQYELWLEEVLLSELERLLEQHYPDRKVIVDRLANALERHLGVDL